MNPIRNIQEHQFNWLLSAENSDGLIVNAFNLQNNNGDTTGTNMAYVNYKPAELKNTGNKFFIQYSFRHPVTKKWVRFKRYGIGENMGLNRVKDLPERIKLGESLVRAFNIALSQGYNPFEQPEQKEWTMFQALNRWKINTEQKADRKATVKMYSSVVNTYLKHFKKVHYELGEISRSDVEEFLAGLKKKNSLSNTSYNSYLQVTKVFFNYCVIAEMVGKSPAEGIKPLKAVVSKHKYFTDDEFEKIKKHAPEKLLRFMEFLYHSGLRPKEARFIKYKDVSSDQIFISGQFSKNKKDEYIPINPEYAKTLVGDPDLYIFGGKKPIGENYYGRMFAELKALLKLDENIDLYSLRHTKACHLIKDGVEAYAVMRFLRHSGLEMTMRYIRGLGLEINREAVEKGRSF